MTITCFLTLDGVTHPAGSFVDSNGMARTLTMGAEPFQWAWAIGEDAVSRDAQFVICSHWLQKMSLQQLREQAPHWMRPRIVGACEQFDELDDLQRPRRVRSAWSVIDAYASAHGIRHWVAVDHTDEGWPPDAEMRERLVLCDPALGLRDRGARESLRDALWRESVAAGQHVTASLVVASWDEHLVSVRERWHLDFTFPQGDGTFDVPVVLLNEGNGRTYLRTIEGYRGGDEHLARFALKAMWFARFGAADPPANREAPGYPWNRLEFTVSKVGFVPLDMPWLRLAIDVYLHECLVAYAREEGWIESHYRSLVSSDVDPVQMLTREVEVALAAEQRLPC
jgi:hypothetical protein